jgi:hypothetical protein
VDVEILQLFIVVLCPRPKFHSGVSTVEFIGIARFAAPYLSGGANRTVDLKLHQSQLADRLLLELVHCRYTSPTSRGKALVFSRGRPPCFFVFYSGVYAKEGAVPLCGLLLLRCA